MNYSDKLIEYGKEKWKEMFEHPFIQGMIDGTLKKEYFLKYLIQDSKYLVEYAKVYAYAFIKNNDVETMRHIYQDMGLINTNESMMHIRYLKDLGYSEEDCFNSEFNKINRDYLDFMLKVAREGSDKEAVVAVLPCAFSYYDIACYMLEEAKKRNTLEGNYFRHWFEDYSSDSYKVIYDSAVDLCNMVIKDPTEEEDAKYKKIFLESCDHELKFWSMGMEE
ncbi:MAG: thiaminase II [Erysipelotrichaceae bacterium]|nr:thiaminase II [Erysipelotrichaceae bacterium]